MANIILVRHATTALIAEQLMGRTAGNTLDAPGKKQAEVLAEYLGSRPIAAMYSSPMERAVQTARPLAHKLQLEVQIAPPLQEIDYGDWTGLSFSALASHSNWRAYNEQRSRFAIPGGEDMLAVQNRMVLFIEEVARKHAAESVALFSHGDPIRIAIGYYIGMPIDFIHRIEIAPASCSTISITNNYPCLTSMNFAVL